MDRLAFLKEECSSVKVALQETLRHDYGPERSRQYYVECDSRLEAIGQAIEDDPAMSRSNVADMMRTLGEIGSRVALIERSHLGEFSWPFSEAIRSFAERLFEDEQANGRFPPIVHVIAEGIGYQIVDDAVDSMSRRRILIVAFPRHLRHHVLLHSIFGHELGHPALKSDATAVQMFGKALPALKQGPLFDEVQLMEWLRRDNAPKAVRDQLADNPGFSISAEAIRDWRIEILCDLFGLVLFGPPYAAAHRTILEPQCAPPQEYAISSTTHPPYPLRRRVIADAMRLLGWTSPVLAPEDAEAHDAEVALIRYTAEVDGAEWDKLLSDEALGQVLSALTEVFAPHEGMRFERPGRPQLKKLIERLRSCRPPIVQGIDGNGRPKNERIPIQQCLYAGWSFWFGRDALQAERILERGGPPLTFLQVNRLCEQALLQQRAIDAVLDHAR